MEIVQTPIASLKPYEKNAKKHPDKQVGLIAASIREFGFNQPIVVDKDGVIIVGHGRYFAASMLGLEEVPVLTLDIPEEKARAYRLADNKLNESDWDMQLVVQELKTLNVEDIDLTGFSRDLVIEDDDRDDEVPKVPKEAKTKRGDIYQIGKHRILCGDSTSPEDFQKLMDGAKADMIFTDPPYNVNYKGKGANTSSGIMNDKMTDEQFRDFLLPAFKNMRESIKAGGGLYVFHSDKTQVAFEQALEANGLHIKNQLIWNKPSAGMGMGDYRSKHEPFFYACINGESPRFYGDRTNATVVDFQKTDAQLLAWAKKQRQAENEGKHTVWTMRREPVQDYVHPKQKPVELITYAIMNSSKTEDIVLDPFLGSGSTIIGAEKTNRACYGMELDPIYMDVIVERYCHFTGNREITRNGEPIHWDAPPGSDKDNDQNV